MTTDQMLQLKKGELELTRHELQETQQMLKSYKAKAWDLSVRLGEVKQEIESLTLKFQQEQKEKPSTSTTKP